MITIAKYIAEFLSKKGIKLLPVFQGGAVMHLIDAVGENRKLDYFVPYHEQALSMQVDTMSRLNGFGAGMATSGPGATNLLTGVCSAFYDSIPCFYFTGQVGQIHLKQNRGVRQLGFQETDVYNIFKPITKYCVQINDPKTIKYELEKGFFMAKSDRPGPVVFDIPYNIQRFKIVPAKLRGFKTPKIKQKIFEQNKKIKNLIRLVNNSKKPLILAGGGIKRAGKRKEFLKFIKKYNFPFVTTWMSQDLTEYNFKNYNGSIGKNGHMSANMLTENCDLIICIGQRFAVKNILKNFGKNAKIVAIDIDENELKNGLVKPNLAIKINIKDFFIKIGKFKIKKTSLDWSQEAEKIKKFYFDPPYLNNNLHPKNKKNYINVYEFFKKISKLVPNKSILFPDAGANQVWFFQSFLQKKGQIIINHSGHSPMGHAVCASIAGYFSRKNSKIIALIGDGGLMMNLQEIEFIKANKLPIKIIVLDNRCLGNTKLGNMIAFNGRSHANDGENKYYPPDVKKIVNGFGLDFFEFTNGSDKNLKNIFSRFLKVRGPSVLRVNLSEFQNVIDFN